MHVRFIVPVDTTIFAVNELIGQIGNPKLLFHDYYFVGEIDPKYLVDLYRLKGEGKIANLGFLVVNDHPAPGLQNDSD